MSKNRQSSEYDIRISSSYKIKSRNSIDCKRISLPFKAQKESANTPNQLPKTRSISTLNTKSTHKLRSISPKLHKLSSNNSSMINITSYDIVPNCSQRSINDSHRQAYKDSLKVNSSYKSSKNPSDSLMFLEKLKSLRKLPIESSITEYFKIFEEIIEKDKAFRKPLNLIKQALSDWELIKKRNLDSVESLKRQLNDANIKISALNEDRKYLDRRMNQITQENLELVKSLEESEAAYTEIEEKLLKVADFRVDKLEKSEENWKALVMENKAYLDIMKKMKTDLKSYKSKESKLLKLVLAMKNRGFPVEEVYNKEVYGNAEPINDSESDRIVTGSSPRREKPEIVPKLPIDKIECEIFTSSNCSSLDKYSF